MAAIAIQMPLVREEGPASNADGVMKDPLPEAAGQTWLKNSLVQVVGTGAAAALQRCAADAILVYGQAPQQALGTTSPAILLQPPQALFGLNHYPFDLLGRVLEINASNGSLSGANIGANGVTWAGGGTGGVALAPGQQYGLITLTSGTYSGYQMLDVTETTAKMFEIVALAPQVAGVTQAVTDNNPRLWVKIILACLQG